MFAPVAFPPGRLYVATKPSLIGSPPIAKTIGIVEVADLAASAAGVAYTAEAAPQGLRSEIREGPRAMDQNLVAS